MSLVTKFDDEKIMNKSPGIHTVAKPIGPICNLNCEYCSYLEKWALFGAHEQYRMTDDILSAFIASYGKSQPTPVVSSCGREESPLCWE